MPRSQRYDIPGRARHRLRMIGVDPIVRDVGQLVRTEQRLIGDDRICVLIGDRPIGVRREMTEGEFSFRLDAPVLGLIVVERRENVSLPELTVVQKIARALVIGVDAHLQGRTIGRGNGRLGEQPARSRRTWRQQLLGDAHIDHGRSFRKDRPEVPHRGRIRRVVEILCLIDLPQHLRRRREIARVPCVEDRTPEGLVDEVEARTDLVLVDELHHLVEANAGVERQLAGQLPFILNVGAKKPAELIDAVANVGRVIDRFAGGIERLDRGQILHLRLFAARDKSRPDGVNVRDLVGHVALNAVEERGSQHVGCGVVEQQVVGHIGNEMQTAVARKI